MQQKFTLEDIQLLQESKYRLTRERFLFHFIHRFGYSKEDAENAYSDLQRFPLKLDAQRNVAAYENRLTDCIQLIKELYQNWNQILANNWDREPLWKKVLYREDNKAVKELEIDLYAAEDIVTYAALIQRKEVSLVAMLDLCAIVKLPKLHKHDLETIRVYEGDLYSTEDSFWSSKKSTVVVAIGYNKFRRLNYIKGKGYLKKGELNIDDEKSFNHFILTADNGAVKMGNRYVDVSFLSDEAITK